MAAAVYSYGTESLPTLAETDEVQFFYLEAALPFNVPSDIAAKAGSSFTAYAAAHCGLGVYDSSTNVKFSIEFVALNYTGALLPTGFDERNGTSRAWRWNNAGALAVALPLNDAAWTNSRLVSITSGTAWLELRSWLQRNYQGDLYYQPVSVVAGSPSGAVLVSAFDSYALAQAAIAQLASFGAPLNSFVSPATTAFVYTALDATKPSIVSWPAGENGGNELAPSNVRAWFLQLSTCYRAKFAQLPPAQDGFSFLANAQACYGSAEPSFVYLSPTSVYSLQLAASPLSPALLRAPYTLPSTPAPAVEALSATDLGFLIALALFVSCGMVLLAKHVLCARNGRLAAEMDKMAEEAVGSILEGHESGRDSLYEYFYPRPTGLSGLLARARDWLSGGSSGGSRSSGSGSRRGEGAGSRKQGLSGLSTRQLAREYRVQQRDQTAAASTNPFHSPSHSLNPFADDDDPYYAISDPREPLVSRNTVSI